MKYVVLFCIKNELFSGCYTLLSVNKRTLTLTLTLTQRDSLWVNNLWSHCNSATFIGRLHRGYANAHIAQQSKAQHNRCLDIVSLYYVYNFIVDLIVCIHA